MNVRSIKPGRWWAFEKMSVTCIEGDKSLDPMTPKSSTICLWPINYDQQLQQITTAGVTEIVLNWICSYYYFIIIVI